MMMMMMIIMIIMIPDGVELHQRFKSVDHLGVVPVGRLCLMTEKTQRLKIERMLRGKSLEKLI